MLTALLFLSLFVWLAVLFDASAGFRKLERLEDEAEQINGPLLSIIVAARNEEENIESSIISQLKQNYKNIEWVLVNDRSTDKTGKIMDQLRETDKRIKIIHIQELPKGWLGKNYALYTGTKEAAGDSYYLRMQMFNSKNKPLARQSAILQTINLIT
ncbi:glycosyltransferase family 2 protein [Cytobacillus solani]|uniref:glycosyltransferase family 2 protein n=1 Tax=Cytobacillus solani TaxID=1637975 RepID=UPI000A59A036